MTGQGTASAAQIIHQANDGEMATVADILASAFMKDPILNWLCGEPASYAALFRAEAEALYKSHKHIYINDAGSGAAMWLPGGVSHKAPFHWRFFPALWQLATAGGLDTLKRGALLDKVMAANHPKQPHFYLHAIGAARQHQGQGIGSALLKAGLAACDAQNLPAYLESSNEKNNALYQRHGFEITGDYQLPDGGPSMWFMWRNARS